LGQAKLRGSKELRIAEALAKIEPMKPRSIVCNNCKAELTDIGIMNTKGMRGIDAAFAAHCEACDHNTWAVRGDPNAVAELFAAMEETTGEEVKLGTAKLGNTE
jgi:hypothetical protein